MKKVAGVHSGCGKVESNRIERLVNPHPGNRWGIVWDGTQSALGLAGFALTGPGAAAARCHQ